MLLDKIEIFDNEFIDNFKNIYLLITKFYFILFVFDKTFFLKLFS